MLPGSNNRLEQVWQLNLSTHKYRSNAECPTCLCREAPEIRTVKGTPCVSKKNKTFHRKALPATFHTSTNLFDTCVSTTKLYKRWRTYMFMPFQCSLIPMICLFHSKLNSKKWIIRKLKVDLFWFHSLILAFDMKSNPLKSKSLQISTLNLTTLFWL